ncbi:hypothetical protein X798_00894 [Onchocerca flexuosa]|uniref:Uncharacterized protein n=1 Tax=Onchocerca flexuosa TaxID=387005 RepID=A0A238C2U8_9BILA|nr:hypothetical protein X798_00894 [Onchocerca flexuosa]
MMPHKVTNKRIFNAKNSKYECIPVDVNDEPTLINYTGRYKKNEARSRHSSGESQTAISHPANQDKIDRPNPSSNRVSMITKAIQWKRL